ncbi:amino acid adenylation domain-containing protein [Bacillus atrophaeus]|uniref:non-ribosomal peptide synthetase n=1 Tax=Bacillus atrophaeus TaxID=1452 RepID=UPI0022815C22|nr:non-ribosomal peptide synthetase [Bacillus atrophaeus]MCY9107205.1 amino acid adenylation domain-containing protein [Bacillus atrophaeus]
MTQATGIQDIYPLSYMQEGMLFHSLLHGDSKAYVEQTSFTINGNLCIDSFQKSLNLLVSRYDIFRTIFIKEVPDLSGPQQVVLTSRELTVKKEDISGMEIKEQHIFIEEFKKKDREKGFDLQKDPLMRLTLFDMGENRHTCVWTHHHIIMDGWCLGIVLKEFFHIYYSLKNSDPLQLGSTVPYSRYIGWLGEQDKEETGVYWDGYLSDYGQTASIPLTNNRRKDGVYVSEQIHFSLDPSSVEKLTALSRSLGVTLNTLFMSIWGVMLHRYNATDDAVFGSVISGRPSTIDGIESMVGLFINTIPVRVRAHGGMSFSSLVKEVQKDTLASENHGYYPLYEIQNRSPLKQGLLNHILVFENYPVQIQKAVGAWQGQEENALKLGDFSMSEETNYDLNVVIVPGDNFYIKFSYNASVYKQEDMLRIQGHLKKALDCILSDPDIAVENIDIVPVEEQMLIHTFNKTDRSYPEKTVYELFEDQAAETPEATALVLDDTHWTYRQLDERANQMARVLKEKGAKPGSIVAVMMRRSKEMAAALLGIWKAGSAYMPLDPGYPSERLSFLLDDSETSLLLTEDELISTVPSDYAGDTVTTEEALSYKTDPLPTTIQAGKLAYLIYTSGTTGRPKGVLVDHRGIANTLQWRREEYGMSGQDTALHLFSYVFDGCVTSLFTPLLSGACVILTNDDDAKDVLAIKKTIAKHRVTHLLIVPSLHRVLLEVLEKEEAKTLRVVTFAGEPVTADLLEASREICPHTELANEYGPTENSVATTVLRHLNQESCITIGRPIANTEVCILIGNQLQPIGASGELCIGGAGLAQGYYKQTELSQKAFTSHPFREGERLYRTGDAARWLQDGTLEYIGRFDDQVKIRGYRIELGEVEAVLRNIPGVKEAAVVARETSSDERELFAYIVPQKGDGLPNVHLHLAGKLPAYMIPASITKINKMPLTSSGKLDRSALPEPMNMADSAHTYEPPRTIIESELTAIWKNVLNKKQIGIRDDFFHLGGQSLKAATLVSRIHKKLNIQLPLSEVFIYPTVESMAAKIESLKEQTFTTIAPAQSRELYPLSFSQKRMYTLHQLEENGTGYNMPAALELHGKLDRQRLKQAVTELVNRHESLRTSFVIHNGELMQQVHVSLTPEFTELQIESKSQLKQTMQSFIQPFVLTNAPLLRACLIVLENDHHYLLLDMHHIAADGVSMSTLIQEFTDLYCGKTLHPLKLQYKDFAVWQKEQFARQLFSKQEDYWLKQLSGLPVLELPLDKNRPLLPDFSGGTFEAEIDRETAERLHRIMSETGCTLYMVLLAAYSILLSKLSGQKDIVVGSPAAGRRHADLEPVIGLFVNTLAMRSQPEGEKSFRSYLQEIKEVALTAYEHQDYPFEELTNKLGTQRELNRNPLFDAMLVLQSSEDFQLELPGLAISSRKLPHKASKFDLTLHAEENNEGIRCCFEYSTALFEHETVARWANHFKELLRSITADTDVKLADMQMLGGSEQRMLLDNMHHLSDYPSNKSLPDLFENWAKETPEHIAVVMDDHRLTYRELNDQAERAAAMLMKKGVRSEQIVGLMTERSPDMLIGILAILKAGGAYLPIDPDYPQERISFMLNDSGAEMLLTHAAKERPDGYQGEILYIEDAENEPASDVQKPPVRAEQPAYIIYTSGTTGQPKGVAVEHRNVVSLLKHKELPFDFGPQDVWTLFHSYCFDFSVWEMFGALLNGGTLVVVSKETARDPNAYRLLLKEEGVTVLNQTPTAFYSLMHEEQSHADALSVRYVIFGGEALQPGMLRSWKGKYPETDLINMYGITETTVHVTYKKLTDTDIAANKSNIGKPLATLTAYVLDDYMNFQPIGVPGELYVGGAGVAKGYVNREELTAVRFIPNPYVSGDRLYRTGDIAKRLPNGELEYAGRIDNQVKVRGHRIELGEIKAALLKHSLIKEAAVITRLDEQGQHTIYAYLISETDRKLNQSKIRASLKAVLPDYMIPARFMQLDSMPLTSNGKLDQKALPEPDAGTHISDDILPRNDTEKVMAEIWEELLGLEQLGVSANFFELGGDSIKALQVCARLKQHGFETTVRELFEHQTLGELSARVRKIERVIDQAPVSGEMPWTPVQHWLFSQSMTSVHHFNQSVMLYRADRFNSSALREVLKSLVKHHDALRIVCRNIESKPVQVNRGIDLTDEELYFFQQFDIRDDHAKATEHPASLSSEEKRRIAETADRIQQNIQLETGPLLHAGLFRASDGDHLLLAIHHLVIDGVSWRILFEDFEIGYEQALAGKPIVFPQKTDSFHDYAHQLAAYSDTRGLFREIDYWTEREKQHVERLPRDYTVSSNKLKDTNVIDFELSRQDTEQLLTSVNKAYTTDTNDILLAALGLSLQEWTGYDHLKISMEGHGRESYLDNIDLSRTVGWFTSIYPVLLDMDVSEHTDEKERLGYHIKRTKDMMRRIPHKGVGYGVLKYVSGIWNETGNISNSPEISFNYLGQFDQDIQMNSFEVSPVQTGDEISPDWERPYILDISGAVSSGCLKMHIVYNRYQYEAQTIQTFAGYFKRILEDIIRHCAAKENREWSAADFSDEELTLEDLSEIMGAVNKL